MAIASIQLFWKTSKSKLTFREILLANMIVAQARRKQMHFIFSYAFA